MKHLILSLLAIFVAVGLPLGDAHAKRFGGGKSSGMQRDSYTQRQATPQRDADAPSRQNAAGAANNPAGKRSWLGPVAGLAAGLGLAALASHFGFGEEMANMLMIALLAMGAFLLFKFLTRNRARAATPYAMQYAGAAPQGGDMPFQPAAMSGSTAAAHPALPAGFDAEGFVRQAKLNFIRLQTAYDAGNLDDIREFTSPEMFAEIQLQIGERGQAEQHTEVLNVAAEVLECTEEPNRQVVSVRFHGLIREDKNAPASDFDEVWHLTRPADGSHGWVVAGIQQVN